MIKKCFNIPQCRSSLTKYIFLHRNKPYDSKKSVWMNDGEGGFVEGLLQSDDGKKAVVMVGHEVNYPFLACSLKVQIF